MNGFDMAQDRTIRRSERLVHKKRRATNYELETYAAVLSFE
jgi:hypothetical protein